MDYPKKYSKEIIMVRMTNDDMNTKILKWFLNQNSCTQRGLKIFVAFEYVTISRCNIKK